VAQEPKVIEFFASNPAAVIEVMDHLAVERDGWVNLHPWLDDEVDEAAGVSQSFLGWLSARGPEHPEGTWVPGEQKRRGRAPDSIGLRHAGGAQARFKLADKGVPVPAGWIIKADHPKRGLVLELPDGTPPSAVIDWLLRAAAALTPAPLPDRWAAVVWRR
jgi:hypothetical protein